MSKLFDLCSSLHATDRRDIAMASCSAVFPYRPQYALNLNGLRPLNFRIIRPNDD
jgi:hypothetical protein